MSALSPQDIVAYYSQRGVPQHVAAALAGNFVQESSLNPGAINSGEGAYGLGQWRGDRAAALFDFARNRGTGWDDPTTQLDFVLHEFGGPERGAAQQIFATRTPEEATYAVAKHYERAGNPTMENRLRGTMSALGGLAKRAINYVIPAAHAGSDDDDGFEPVSKAFSAAKPAASPPAPVVSGKGVSGDFVPPPAGASDDDDGFEPVSKAFSPTQSASSAPKSKWETGTYTPMEDALWDKSADGGWSAFWRGMTDRAQKMRLAGQQNAIESGLPMQPANPMENARGMLEGRISLDSQLRTAPEQAVAIEQNTINPRLQQIEQDAAPYQQAHPGFYGFGEGATDLLASVPWLAMGQPALALGQGGKTLAISAGKRLLADMLMGAGQGGQQAMLTPVDTAKGDYGTQKANLLADAVEGGAIAGPVADAVLLGGAATIGGVIKGMGKVVNWLTGERAPLSPEALDWANRLDMGGDLTAFDRSGNKVLLNTETISRHLPGGGKIEAGYQAKAQKAMAGARDMQTGVPLEESGNRVAQEIVGNRAARNNEQELAAKNFAQQYDVGVTPDEGVQTGLRRQLEENRQKIRDAYAKVQQVLIDEGKQNSPIALPATQQAASELLGALSPDAWKSLANPSLKAQLEKIVAGTQGGDSLMSAISGVGRQNLPGSMTFSEMLQLSRNLSDLYGKARRATGGVGSAEERAFTRLRLALQQDSESWAKSIGSPKAMQALQDANQFYRDLKVPYSKGGVPGVNTVVSNPTTDKAYSTLFDPSHLDRAAQAFPLLDDAGQKSAKYGAVANILKAATAKGEFDPKAFMAAAKDQQPLLQKIFSPSELKAFGDLTERIGTMPVNAALEKAAQNAIDKADPSSFMTAFSSSAKSDAPVKALMSKLSTDGRQAVADWIIDSAYRRSVDEVGNRLSLAKYATFLKQHETALQMAGRWDGVKGLVQLFDRIQRVAEATAPGIPATGVRVASLYGVGEFVKALLGAVGVGSPGGVGMVAGGYVANKALSRLLTTPGGYEVLAWLGRKSGAAADRAMLDPGFQRGLLIQLGRAAAVAGATGGATTQQGSR